MNWTCWSDSLRGSQLFSRSCGTPTERSQRNPFVLTKLWLGFTRAEQPSSVCHPRHHRFPLLPSNVITRRVIDWPIRRSRGSWQRKTVASHLFCLLKGLLSEFVRLSQGLFFPQSQLRLQMMDLFENMDTLIAFNKRSDASRANKFHDWPSNETTQFVESPTARHPDSRRHVSQPGGTRNVGIIAPIRREFR